MPLESATHISDLNASNPVGLTDTKATLDDHIRLLKSVLKTDFANISGAVTASHTELNYVDGVTSAIQTQLDAKAPIASPTFTGTPAAPTASVGTGGTQIATCGFVAATAFVSALPAQTGNSGKFVTTDGTNASWGEAVTPAGSQTLTNKTISGADNTLTVDGTHEVGFRGIPIISKSENYTLVLTDAGKNILHPSADVSARTFTIPANASVAFPAETAVTFTNQNGAGVITIAITSDTMRLAGAGTTGSRTLAANGVATAIKLTATEWIISGTGLT